MPITRNAIIDDSGAGTDGTVIDNAWKQELYNQIDALTAGLSAPVNSPFAFTDGSGAGLVFPTSNGYWSKIGPLIVITAQVIWPATANGLAAKLAGLPYVPSGNASLYEGFGAVHVRTWAAGVTTLEIYAASSGGPMTNAMMSGVNLTLHGVYLAF